MTELVSIKIYQIEETLDTYSVKFKDSDYMKRCYFDKPSLLSIYEKVYEGMIELENEDFERLFDKLLYAIEENSLPNFIGTRALQVSDLVIIDDIHYFYIDSETITRLY